MEETSERACYICNVHTRFSLPSHLTQRLETTLCVELQPRERTVDEGGGGSINICKACMTLLEKIEEMVGRLQHLYKYRKESRSVRKRKPGFELAAFLPENGHSHSTKDRKLTRPDDNDYDEDEFEEVEPRIRKVWSTSKPYVRHKRGAMYTCSDCGDVFAKLSLLGKHCALQHSKKWVCPEKHCCECFKTRDELALHKNSHNQMSSLLLLPLNKCEPDRKQYSNSSEQDDPMQVQESEKSGDHSYNQNIVGPNTPGETKPEAGNKPDGVDHLMDDYPCPVCDNSYQREFLLKKHVETSHWYKSGRELFCTHCNIRSGSLDDMLPHCREHRRDMIKCTECSLVFLKKQHVTKHRASAHLENSEFVLRVLNCKECNESFETPSLLSYHTLLKHSKLTQFNVPRPVYEYQCGQCCMSFLYTKDLRVHVKTIHGSLTSVYECGNCVMLFKDQASLDEHLLEGCGGNESAATSSSDSMVSENTDFQVPCPICDSIYGNVPQLEVHIRRVHWVEGDGLDGEGLAEGGGTYTCSFCGLVFSDKKETILHARSHRAEMAACSKCPGSAIPNASQINCHNLTEHSAEKDPTPSVYACGNCGLESKTIHLLSYHMYIEHNQYLQAPILDKNLFKCRQCDKAFSSTTALRTHVLIHHTRLRPPRQEPQNKEEFVCVMCGDNFEESIVFEHHVTKCTGVPRSKTIRIGNKLSTVTRKKSKGFTNSRPIYQCKLCGVTYMTHYSYKIHIMEHQGVTTIDCDKCDRKFYTHAQLKNHMLTHTKPHKCTDCGAAFALKAHLKDHSVIHSKELDQYKCDICDRSFRWRFSLSRHRSVEHDVGYKYKARVGRAGCKLCGTEILASGIRRHFKNVHKNVKLDPSHYVILPDRDPSRRMNKKKAAEELTQKGIIGRKEATCVNNGHAVSSNVTGESPLSVEILRPKVASDVSNQHPEVGIQDRESQYVLCDDRAGLKVYQPIGEGKVLEILGLGGISEQQLIQNLDHITGPEQTFRELSGGQESVKRGLEKQPEDGETEVIMRLEKSGLNNASVFSKVIDSGAIMLSNDMKIIKVGDNKSKYPKEQKITENEEEEEGLGNENLMEIEGEIAGTEINIEHTEINIENTSGEGRETEEALPEEGIIITEEALTAAGLMLNENGVVTKQDGQELTALELTSASDMLLSRQEQLTLEALGGSTEEVAETGSSLVEHPVEGVEVVYVTGEERNVTLEIPDGGTDAPIHYVITYDT